MNGSVRHGWRRALCLTLLVMAVSSVNTMGVTANQESGASTPKKSTDQTDTPNFPASEVITVFVCGDVMTGRGIDQILPSPSDPVIHESYMRSAYGYVELAEQVNGLIPKPVSYAYIWADALAVLAQIKPDLRIINLETSVTRSNDYWPKGINYRMHPDNIGYLSAARIDCCVLANNHVLDWGRAGLVETMEVLSRAGIVPVGAGKNRTQTTAPAIFPIVGKGRLLVFAYGAKTSGIPGSWAATETSPGINVLPDLSFRTVDHIKNTVAAIKQPGDVVLLSLHWGGNWGYAISETDRAFAHKLIDDAGVDAIYGHSSHHAKGIEVYQGKLILYGCGDFLNDYEGIGGHEHYRSDLALMYFPSFNPLTGRLVQLRLVPMRINRFQTIHTTPRDNQWLLKTLNREGKQFGTAVRLQKDGSFRLVWD